jgi:hypothetical protein
MATHDNTPATKRDLGQLDERMLQMQQEMREMHAQLQEQMRDMQTELLKAFLPWQEGVHTQFRESDSNNQ